MSYLREQESQHGYICHLERGTRGNPSYRTMSKISSALKRKVQEVFNVG